MTIAYRDATADDLPGIDRLFRTSFAAAFAHLYRPEDLEAFFFQFTPAAWAEEFDDPRYAFRVAEDGAELGGFVKLGPPSVPVESKEERLELRQIYVLEQWQGRGIARALIDWAIGEAKRRGARELYLTVYIDNDRARKIYDGYGFVPVGSYAFMVGSHADEDVIMRLSL